MRRREMRRGQRERSGNWRAGCLKTSTSGSEEGGWKRAARAVPRQPPILLGLSVLQQEKKESDQYLTTSMSDGEEMELRELSFTPFWNGCPQEQIQEEMAAVTLVSPPSWEYYRRTYQGESS